MGVCLEEGNEGHSRRTSMSEGTEATCISYIYRTTSLMSRWSWEVTPRRVGLLAYGGP